MEFDGIRKLKESLDKCLLAHATELCGNNPTVGSVYELQGLAEVHCYLKTMHDITPNEADALLRFADPLGGGICLLGGQSPHLQLPHL